MNLAEITPLILTWNEEANIGRTLEGLTWAARIVVVDSGSTDGTAALVARHPNAELVYREFDNHAAQWNFGLDQVDTPWVLALDADYVCPRVVCRRASTIGAQAITPTRLDFAIAYTAGRSAARCIRRASCYSARAGFDTAKTGIRNCSMLQNKSAVSKPPFCMTTASLFRGGWLRSRSTLTWK